ncbi:MAG: hypothetical protein AMJ43_04965 [Coxiella sp. DG_40]|nr:MAG: hypothetical protein AMJ43_04965 [Coxiella sp. DG_40]
MINKKSQHGFLLIAAVILIVIIGLFAAAIVYMFVGSTVSINKYQSSKQAFYEAESGLQFGLHKLMRSDIACTDINTIYPNPITFKNGQFKITSTLNYPSPSATLSSAIDPVTTVIPLTSSLGYANQGRVIIGKEAIDYAAISGNSLIGAHRGSAGTIASEHSIGSNVRQNQCTLISEGVVPDFSNPHGKSIVQGAIYDSQFMWAVGKSGTILTWNGLAWQLYPYSPTSKNLNGVSTLSDNSFGFAVGDSGTIIKYTGSNWVTVTSPTVKNLQDVSVISNTDAWAVGDDGVILHWDGTTWNNFSSPTTNNLEAVSMLDSTFGLATGVGGTILRYNGSSWQIDASPTSENLHDVIVISNNEAWISGSHGIVLGWDGSSWKIETSPVTTSLQALDVRDNKGWAVGEGQHNVFYNGIDWMTTKPSADNLKTVKIYAIDDAWAAGVAGKLVYWNGVSWQMVDSPTNNAIYDFSNFSKKKMFIMWSIHYN